MASAVDSRLAYARLSAVATASRLPTATRGSNNSYTTSWDTTLAVMMYVHYFGRSQLIDATLYLKRRGGVYADEAKIWSRVQCGREDGVVGSLAARGVVEGDWSGVWQAVIVDLFPAGAAWRDPAGAPLPLAAGVDLMGTRGDIPRDRGPALDPIDGVVAGPVAVDGALSANITETPAPLGITVGRWR